VYTQRVVHSIRFKRLGGGSVRFMLSVTSTIPSGAYFSSTVNEDLVSFLRLY
jgi:hypothetical protein